MIVRLFHSGISKGESPVNYLLGDMDHQGKPRAVKPEVLDGDPQTTIAVINSIDRKYKYSSGCLSFRDSERPTKEQMLEIIDDFKATFCPGLTANHFNSLFVLHQDKGNTEIHFVIPTQELTSGRRMNIHPPGQRNLEFFEAYTRVTNHKLGYAQIVPDPLKMAFSDFERKTPEGKNEQSDKRWVHQHVIKAVANGTVKNRDDLCRYLDEDLGITVTRQGEDYISVKFPGAKKAKRFRGNVYSRNADYRSLLTQSAAAKQPKYLTPQEFQTERGRLSEFIQEREQFNKQHYLSIRPIRRLAKPYRPVHVVQPEAHRTSITRSPIMKNTVHLPSIRKIILHALMVARERVQEPVQPMRTLPAVQTDHKKTIFSIKSLREKAFTSPRSVAQTGFAELVMTITELEVSLYEAMGDFAYAQGEKAEKLKQRIIQLQLQLTKLHAQKAQLPVEDDEQVWKGGQHKFKK